jgi:hypothetical protein
MKLLVAKPSIQDLRLIAVIVKAQLGDGLAHEPATRLDICRDSVTDFDDAHGRFKREGITIGICAFTACRDVDS